ncbi:SEC-C domain-containing protein [Chitinophaga agrisoli]|uniref:SEC-C domain-containing protein n=1 Tax=Chitinophaga agrisoli TaxID=2607653 RepID=A0A5B2VNL7_9BACT|nr:SEC-C domain-containing protein [Chitinophaga agrisoli]KAA2240308.1 SEC-C domain-containing protein [Chitinophaga agrisoli]
MSLAKNAPCHCGSGKKYKRCHYEADLKRPIKSQQAFSDDPLLAKLSNGNSQDLLATLGALQLNAANHGKNIRMEQLALHALRSHRENDQRAPISFERLKYVVENYTEDRYLEDPPVSLFTENVSFLQGNHTVLPGIGSAHTELLNALLRAIMGGWNKLPQAFIKAVCPAVDLMLFISDTIAKRAGLQRYQSALQTEDYFLQAPPKDVLDIYKEAVSISDTELAAKCQQLGISSNVLDHFTVNFTDPRIVEDRPEPILVEQPLVRTSTGIICLTPTTIVTALVKFIFTSAETMGAKENLSSILSEDFARQVDYAMFNMSHQRLKLPIQPLEDTSLVVERLYFFDTNKFSYVCVINGEAGTGQPEEMTDLSDTLAQRGQQVKDALQKIDTTEPYQLLTLFVTPEVDKEMYFSMPKSTGNDRSLHLKSAELEAIAYHQDSERLTLWKFAGSYGDAHEKTFLFSAGGIMDAFAIYLENEGSILPTDEDLNNGGTMMVAVGSSNDLQQQGKKERDEHSISRWEKDIIGYAVVRRFRQDYPIYIEHEISPTYRIVLEIFDVPVWAVNNQKERATGHTWAHDVCEAVLFWLYKMKDVLRSWIGAIQLPTIEIDVQVDPKVADLCRLDKEPDLSEREIKVAVTMRGIQIIVPAGIFTLIQRSDNSADKSLIRAVLNGLRQLPVTGNQDVIPSEEVISELADQYLQPAHAKMLLLRDVTQHPKTDPRGLPSMRYLQDYDIAWVLDRIVGWLPAGTVVPKNIETREEKTALLAKVVDSLLRQTAKEIAQYNAHELVPYLIAHYERAIQHRESRDFYLPARIACFSTFENEKAKLSDQEQLLVPTALSYRVLIEFVAAVPPTGNKKPNFDDIDRLLAMVDQSITWGMVSDTIHKGFADPQMGLLPSGRLGMDKTFDKEFIHQYRTIKVEAELFKIQSKFEKMYLYERGKKGIYTAENKEVDDAFIAEYGLSLNAFSTVIGTMVDIGFSDGAAFLALPEKDLLSHIAERAPEIKAEEVIAALDLLSLRQRPGLGKPPTGYLNKEVFPWGYNRPLSYLRRPLVRLDAEKDSIYYFGLRHLLDATDNLLKLMSVGKLDGKSNLMKTFMGKVNTQRGKDFRIAVRDWFLGNTTFEVISYEVKIKPGGHLEADKDYGDIDLLVVDHDQKIIYPLECKAIYGARNIHEMKQEMDEYLGKEGRTAESRIDRHIARHQWLQNNYQQLADHLKITGNYKIVSVIITAEAIPLALLKEKEIPLPIISLLQLRHRGLDVLRQHE